MMTSVQSEKVFRYENMNAGGVLISKLPGTPKDGGLDFLAQEGTRYML